MSVSDGASLTDALDDAAHLQCTAGEVLVVTDINGASVLTTGTAAADATAGETLSFACSNGKVDLQLTAEGGTGFGSQTIAGVQCALIATCGVP